MRSYLVPMALLVLLAQAAPAQISSIINSKHNLSASGPGTVRASTEAEICIFCHTPHNAAPVQPLWNRNTPANAYTVYSSNALQAKPGQPTGASKLCLSCHDGTIAVGSVISRDQPIQMAGGITTLPPGASNLGTDLSDDHPISFRYDLDLLAKNAKLKSPFSLPQTVKLDSRGELQCSTCHDAHDNSKGNFLVMDNSNSQLCNTCHNQGHTDVLEHNQCAACHVSHSAPSKAYLLKAATVRDTCFTCHAGQGGLNQGVNIAADVTKFSTHDTHSPVDQRNHIPGNITCNDCHESHTISSGTALAPNISPKLGNIGGVNAAGAAIPKAQYEFEVCFKCHNGQASIQSRVTRQIVQNDTRLEFAPSAISFHPVETQGKNTMAVPSLRPGLTTASVIYCSDCHASDASKAAGSSGPNGPHGSSSAPLLIARYETADFTTESASSYALCYKCHDRNRILTQPQDINAPGTPDNPFPTHYLHVVDNRTSCSACHDSHGVSSSQGSAQKNAHLINFDTTVVQPNTVTHTLEYNSTTGNCTLSCHNHEHNGDQKIMRKKPVAKPKRR
jgi:predicted CXXCH cytochrome family protein